MAPFCKLIYGMTLVIANNFSDEPDSNIVFHVTIVK